MLFVVLLFSSCKKKNNEGPTYTISGHLYEDCNMQPVANTFMDILQGGSGFLTSTTTDNTGYFKLEFKDLVTDFQKIRIKDAGGYNEIMLDIPWQTNIDNLLLYKNPTTNIQVSLNVINPHSVNDTLFIKDFKTITGFIQSGPFTSGILFTSESIQLPVMTYGENNEYLTWYFHPYPGSSNSKYFTISKYCGDTVFVSADIN